MLNYLWAFMMLIGIFWGTVHGTLDVVTAGALDAAKEAVSLCITMLGVISLWSGILEVGEKAGLIEWLAEKMSPILRFLFPRLPKEHPANLAIATNMIANILGLGWAATPAGLKAMEELERFERQRSGPEEIESSTGTNRQKKKGVSSPAGVASREMCTFLIMNISSLQLIPINMIAYRSQYGSGNPMVIVGPAIVATAISTVVAVIFCRIMDR